MTRPDVQYVLTTDTRGADGSGYWRFALRRRDGSIAFEAEGVEPDVHGDRLDLLAVVRALESLDEPARITLTGSSPYVRRGIQHGLAEWRANGWRWERFGQMVPVKHADLWQRVDRALRFHELDCGRRRFDSDHGAVPVPMRLRRSRAEEIERRRGDPAVHAASSRVVGDFESIEDEGYRENGTDDATEDALREAAIGPAASGVRQWSERLSRWSSALLQRGRVESLAEAR